MAFTVSIDESRFDKDVVLKNGPINQRVNLSKDRVVPLVICNQFDHGLGVVLQIVSLQLESWRVHPFQHGDTLRSALSLDTASKQQWYIETAFDFEDITPN